MKTLNEYVQVNERSEWKFEDIKKEIQSLTNSLFYDDGLKGDAACYPLNDNDKTAPTNEYVLNHYFECIKEVLEKHKIKFEYKLG